jgi:uncharacterized protein involved in propanediol utilization
VPAAAGVQIAHSGTVAGIIFDAQKSDFMDAVERCLDDLAGSGFAASIVVGAPRSPADLARAGAR